MSHQILRLASAPSSSQRQLLPLCPLSSPPSHLSICIMTGELHLLKLTYDGEDAYDEMDETDIFEYHYSGWHVIKGDALRAAITYLKGVKAEAAEVMKTEADSASARRFFIEKDIMLQSSVQTSEESPEETFEERETPKETSKSALSEGTALIDDALGILLSWVREPINNGETLLSSSYEMDTEPGPSTGPPTFGFSSMLAKLSQRHTMLRGNDFDGLLDRVVIYPEDARLMVPVLEKVLEVTEDDGQFGQKESVQGLRDLFLNNDGTDAFDYMEESDSFSYRYPMWHSIKGDALRAAITYLGSLKQDAAQAPSPRQFFSDNDITLPYSIETDELKTDEEFLSDGTSAIDGALGVLRSWVREPTNNGRPLPLFGPYPTMSRNSLPGTSPGPNASYATLVDVFAKRTLERQMLSENDLDGLMDRSYKGQKIMDLVYCPVELAKVGMRGMYIFMNLMDNGVFVYPEEAQLIVPALEKVLTVTEDDEDDGMIGQKDSVQKLRNLFAKCSEGTYIRDR
ncbi:hypothetical protein BDP27DRAFT_1405343 [Rhodocollybia butyracea]|uniref:Uncharacterized protein n=1 Tax=Rhodocollybia butyracea TaxID=206335 RepID=A0A9P5PJP6_9AGAR|nr:hypothetical protein BDP27DRAFT_1405343 [Rhodocollybia butyracea]